MKKFLCALLSLAMLLSLVACGNTSQDQSSESNTEDSSEENTILIGISIPNKANEANMNMIQGIEDYVKDMSNVELLILDAEGKGENHMKHAETFISREVDVALIGPYDASAGQPAVEALLEAGIPTITLKAEISDNSICPYVGQDDAVAGEIEMQWVADQLDGKGNIVIIEGPIGNSAQILRNEGIYKVLENYPDINVLYTQTDNWNREDGMSLMENWLQTGAQIDAVVAHNDDMALGAYDALVDAGLDGEILCIGIDAIAAAMQSVAAGELDATVLQDSYGIGAKGIEVALKAVAGETLESTYYIDPVLLTIDNIGDYYTG